MTMFEKHRKAFAITGAILILVLLIFYLYAMLLPGIRYGDAFLYQQKDGSFAGYEMYGYYTRVDYKMDIDKADNGAKISFSVNDTIREYEIVHNETEPVRSVEIFENGESVYDGNAHMMGEEYLLLDGNYDMADEIKIRVDNQVPELEELFPGYTWLYNRAFEKRHDTRGEPSMLLLILLGAAILFIDIKFPDLFWILEHRLEVDGGEPSDWYRSGQKFGRVMLVGGIIVCMILTFTIH